MDRKELLQQFEKASDNQIFFDLAEQVLNGISDNETLADCAELVTKREPGGQYFRAKFWAKAKQQVQSTMNGESGRYFNKLGKKYHLNPFFLNKIVQQGNLINQVERSGTDKEVIRILPNELFEYATRHKDKAELYLLNAVQIVKTNDKVSVTKINNEWCRKNASPKKLFDVIKPSDWWAFGHPKWRKSPDFAGSIPGEIYANALYYFCPEQGVAVDAMAGSGMLRRVYEDRKLWQKELSFNLDIHLYDLIPSNELIIQHDSRNPLPIKADWVFVDPPYFGQSNNYYNCDLSKINHYDEYISYLRDVIYAMYNSMNSGAHLCLFLPKWNGDNLRDNIIYDTPYDLKQIAIQVGFTWTNVAYISRGAQQGVKNITRNIAAKRYKKPISDVCVLNVFSKP